MTYIDIVFSGPPSEPSTFVEVENPAGVSISVGEWLQRPDGYWVLRIPSPVAPSESTDLDALIANTRKHAKDYGWYPSRQECIDLADALESTAAELRRERKRSEEGPCHHQNTAYLRMMRERDDSRAALSRAEGTIDRIRGLRFRLSDSAGLDAILTEYSEQKGASDD